VIRSVSLALAVLAPLPAFAAVGDEVLTGASQPVCETRDALIDFAVAALMKDAARMDAVKNCVTLRPGVPMIIVEEFPGESALGHVARVKVAVPGGNIMFGFTVSLGLKPAR
jgi:hypothetical protein